MKIVHGLQDLLGPPKLENPDKARLARLLTFIVWAAIAVLLILLGARAISRVSFFNPASLILEGLLVVALALIVLIHRGRVQLASTVLVLVGWSAMVLQAWIADGVRDTAVLGQLAIIIICSLLLGWRTAAGLAGLSILSEWAMAVLETRGLLHPGLDDPMGVARDMTGIFLLTAMILYLILSNLQRSMDALRASEERFRKFFDSSMVAIYIAGLEDGRLIEANEAFWKLTGMRPEEALGKTGLELGLWKGREPERRKFMEELKTQRSIRNRDYQLTSRSGKTYDTLAFYELIHLEGRLCLLAMFYDISEQKRAQEELRENEARNRAILNAIPDMLVELDQDGTLLNAFHPQEFEPLLPIGDFLGQKIQGMPAEVISQALSEIQQAVQTGRTQTFEHQFSDSAGTHVYEARIAASGNRRAMVMIRDITPRKKAEAERESLIRELESKNSELEQFTYTVSHDLKSPLITIKGFLGLLRKDAARGDPSHLERDIQHIVDAADKMQRLLNQLLELSRIGRLMNPPQEIPFEALAAEAVGLVQGRLEAKRIQVHIQKGMSRVYGDRQRLVEVVQNLVDNAAKFMGNQAQPCIEIGQGPEQTGKPTFFVRDNGIGIAPEYHQHIFGLFNKLDPHGEGTGVGLALAKRIVEVHGGKMWVESEPGRGSTFFVSLAPKPLS